MMLVEIGYQKRKKEGLRCTPLKLMQAMSEVIKIIRVLTRNCSETRIPE